MANDNIDRLAFIARLTGFGLTNAQLDFVGLALNSSNNEDEFRNHLASQFTDQMAEDVWQCARWAIIPAKGKK